MSWPAYIYLFVSYMPIGPYFCSTTLFQSHMQTTWSIIIFLTPVQMVLSTKSDSIIPSAHSKKKEREREREHMTLQLNFYKYDLWKIFIERGSDI
jgi:hypothetical protein